TPALHRNAPETNFGRTYLQVLRNSLAPCPGACAESASARCGRAPFPESRGPEFGPTPAPGRVRRGAKDFSNRSTHSCQLADRRPLRLVLAVRGDWKCATDPSREFPVTPPRKALPARGREGRAGGWDRRSDAGN